MDFRARFAAAALRAPSRDVHRADRTAVCGNRLNLFSFVAKCG